MKILLLVMSAIVLADAKWSMPHHVDHKVFRNRYPPAEALFADYMDRAADEARAADDFADEARAAADIAVKARGAGWTRFCYFRGQLCGHTTTPCCAGSKCVRPLGGRWAECVPMSDTCPLKQQAEGLVKGENVARVVHDFDKGARAAANTALNRRCWLKGQVCAFSPKPCCSGYKCVKHPFYRWPECVFDVNCRKRNGK